MLQIGEHSLRIDDELRSIRPVKRLSMKSSRIVASGPMTRSTEEWLMSRSCQRATSSRADRA